MNEKSVIVNINNLCKVKLTKAGILKLHKENELFRMDKDTNVLRTELWNIMTIFGDEMYLGAPEMFFKDNKMEIFYET